MSRIFIFISVLFFAITPAQADIPPAAREAMDKGVVAAKQQDYQQALGYFNDARRLAPEAPEVLLNIALAESKIPGRELRAMAWFGAYLSSRPEADNAPAVLEQIKALEVRNHGNILKIVRLYKDAGVTAKEPGFAYHLGSRWREAGDVDSLKQVIDSASVCEANCTPDQMSQMDKDNLERGVNALLLKKGDFDGAKKRAEGVGATLKRELDINTAQAIAISQAKQGNFAAAYQTIDGMDPAYSSPHFADKKNAEVMVGMIRENMQKGGYQGPALAEFLKFFATDGDELNASFYTDFQGALKQIDSESTATLAYKLRQYSAGFAVKTEKVEALLDRQMDYYAVGRRDAVESLKRYIEANPDTAAQRDSFYKSTKADLENVTKYIPLAADSALGEDH